MDLAGPLPSGSGRWGLGRQMILRSCISFLGTETGSHSQRGGWREAAGVCSGDMKPLKPPSVDAGSPVTASDPMRGRSKNCGGAEATVHCHPSPLWL